MSLVGSLEDLSLGDILQIISLSQKSGVLVLKTNDSDGRIVFVNGLVRGAGVKGGPRDLRGVLVDGGFLPEADFAAATDHASSHGVPLASAIGEISSLTQERIDSLCREAIESAVIEMFTWHTGDFSFDVRSEAEADDPELLLPTGINAQYLAMEGARVKDEGEQDDVSAGVADAGAAIDDMSAQDFFGVSDDAVADAGGAEPAESEAETAEPVPVELEPEPLEEVAAPAGKESAVDVLTMATVKRVECDDAPGEAAAEVLDLDERDLLDGEPAESAEPEARPAAAAAQTDPGVAVAADERGALRPLVALDDDLVALEWLKSALKDEFAPIHIFQHTDRALERVRQYLVRGQHPVILISPEMHVDRLGGIRDTVDFVARLKAQSPRVTVLWLHEEAAGPLSRRGAADGVITQPDRSQLRATRSPEQLAELGVDFARKLRIDLAALETEEPARAAPRRRGDISPDAIRRLRDATSALTQASSRGEVLPLVIRFASEVFHRVAMFMVRDGKAVGMAQHGLPEAGGPDDSGLRELSFDAHDSGWMSAVLGHGKPIQGTADTDGDRALVALLGESTPSSVYMAPIESTGQVIALLYGDNLPEDGPIGDTSALEVVLHHAGLALDRAALERALREDE